MEKQSVLHEVYDTTASGLTVNLFCFIIPRT